MKKFYNIKSQNNTTGVYIYGEIIGGSDKWDESDVTFDDFRKALDTMNNGDTLEMYINSPGGSVFTTQGIVNMINRCKKTKNIKVVSYIDGLGASCASWLPMVADEVYVYNTSMLMVHKPMSSLFGANANDMQSEIELLNKLENDIMIPIYMSKATDNLTEDKLKDMMSKETWLNAKEIQELFNVTLIEEDKEIVACADIELLKKYKNMPKNVSFVLFLSLFCVKDSYNFNTNKHFNTLFFPFSHILYQWLTLRRVFPFLKIVVYMAFHNAIVLYPTENLMIINDIHKLITLL